MSLPDFSTQSELFSTAGLSSKLFPEADRYRLFAKLVYPHLAAARGALERCYCADNGRVAVEPVLLLGVSVLQELDDLPDRLAVEALHYHAGWNFALNRQIGDPGFHPTTLVNFRNRLQERDLSALGFTTILQALEQAGLVSRRSRQRLDSTQMFGRVARMSRLDCVRESLRLALEELEPKLEPKVRPAFWSALWERYVESQPDYRAGGEVLSRKLVEAGQDAWRLLEWLRQPACSEAMSGPQAQLLARVFGEQFEVAARTVSPLGQPKEPLVTESAAPAGGGSQAQGAAAPAESAPSPASPPEPPPAGPQPELPMESAAQPTLVEPKRQLDSARVQNPHEPEAAYGAKGRGEKKKEHVGYKVQVAESVTEVNLAPGEPTHNFIMGIVTHPACESDEAGGGKMEREQAAMGLEKPPVQYVDAAYVSAQKLAEAAAQGREIIGPALAAPNNIEGRFTSEAFTVEVQERRATCPAGHPSSQCSRVEEQATGRLSYRFEWDSATCAACPLRAQCIKAGQQHRTLVVGEHHTVLQARRAEQQTPAFKQRMKHRNAIEGTQSELARGHGLRHARYRGLAKCRLQNYFIGAACNVKRWMRLEAWKLRRAASVLAAQAGAAASN
jgi:Transposase DDE domain/Transposase domain (DUF772)